MQKLIKSSVFIIAATVILKSLGLLREIILAYAYGAGVVTDAYVIARTIPDTLIGLLAGCAGACFITICANISKDETDSPEKLRLTQVLITIFGIIGILFTIVFAVFPAFFVKLFAMYLDEQTANTAAQMLRLMAFACIPNLVNTFFVSNLQMKHRFFRAVIYQITINVCIISFIFIGRATGFDVLIGVGFAVGCILSAMLLMIFNKGIGFTYRPSMDLRSPALRAFVLLMIPSLAASVLTQIYQVIDRNMASSFEIGTVSALNYSAKIVNVFVALLGTAVSTAFLPDLTRAAAADDKKAMSEQVSIALKTVIPIVLPLTLGVIILSRQIVIILLERGAFGAGDTDITASLLLMYAVGLFPNCIAPVFSYILIAKKDTKTLLIISVISLCVAIALNFLLVTPMGAEGLALATSASAFFSIGLNIAVIRKRKIRIFVFLKRKEWFKIITAAAIMSAFAFIGGQFTEGGYMKNFAVTAVTAILSVIIYAGVLMITKSETAENYKAFIMSIFTKSSPK